MFCCGLRFLNYIWLMFSVRTMRAGLYFGAYTGDMKEFDRNEVTIRIVYPYITISEKGIETERSAVLVLDDKENEYYPFMLWLETWEDIDRLIELLQRFKERLKRFGTERKQIVLELRNGRIVDVH